ncbi:unnamed protein product [Caenorhabditis bovis]|uniref:RNA helicase n=1 Tax=Caenorhabditis bovis TaxID=2654633 RepID=A0A8S1EXP2_9PELO|nr:unnamed protein product [Caenorhabditis bovis]
MIAAPPPQTSFGSTATGRVAPDNDGASLNTAGGAFGSSTNSYKLVGCVQSRPEEQPTKAGKIVFQSRIPVPKNRFAATTTTETETNTLKPCIASADPPQYTEGSSEESDQRKPLGGAFCSSNQAKHLGGSFGSMNKPLGGAFGSKSQASIENPKPIGGSFGMSHKAGFTDGNECTSTHKMLGGSIGSKSSNENKGGMFENGRLATSTSHESTTFSWNNRCLLSTENTERQQNSTLRGCGYSMKTEETQTSPIETTSPPFYKNSETRMSFGYANDENIPGSFVPTASDRGAFRGGYRGGRGGMMMDHGQGQPGSFRGRGGVFSGGLGRGAQTGYVPQNPFVLPAAQSYIDPATKPIVPVPVEALDKAMVPEEIALLNKYLHKEVNMMKDAKIDIQRNDPTSPLHSIGSFRELRLKDEVLKALDSLGFEFPTRIQETALPLLLMEPPHNLIAQAQSGTGKTAAFVLTMLCRIDVNLTYPQCICLAPTIELAKQIGEVVEKMGKFMNGLRIHYALRGSATRGAKLTEQIVIGTPRMIQDYIIKYQSIDPSKIRCLVLDEADVMIYQQGFTDISTSIYNTIEEASDCVQSMLFSATYDAPVIEFATKLVKNAIVVMLKREEQALPNIKQFYVSCSCRNTKFAAIVDLYSGLAVASSVIFCHTKSSADWIAQQLRLRGNVVGVLHGGMNVEERAKSIIDFKRGEFNVLITTNVLARGIDVPQVSVVINYDLPIKHDANDKPVVVNGVIQPDCETYLHRIGRTGRFGKSGIAINLISGENDIKMIKILESHFEMKIEKLEPSKLSDLENIQDVDY